MPPTPQPQGIQPATGALNCPMHQWIPMLRKDLYTERLTECCVLATWTADPNVPNSVMHVVGNNDYDDCKANLIKQIKENYPVLTHVIAVSGPDGATKAYFEESWFGNIKQAVMNSTLTAPEKASIRWEPPQFNLLVTAPSAIKNCFALLQDGRYGPSHPPPPPSSSSSSSSGSSWGNAPASSRPGSSGSKAASPAPSRPSSSSGTTAGKKVAAAPAKKVVAAPAKKVAGKR